jgi:hypothetical protein
MNHSMRYFCILALSLLLSAATLEAAAAKTPGKGNAAKNTINFERTKTRINALLTQRLKPAPLPETLPNPFQLAATAPLPTTRENNSKPATDGLPPGSDDEMLLYYGAALQISGTVRINERTHLVINKSPYKVGDTFVVKGRDGNAKLRILGIAPGELTLGLNDAVQVIKFKK